MSQRPEDVQGQRSTSERKGYRAEVTFVVGGDERCWETRLRGEVRAMRIWKVQSHPS